MADRCNRFSLSVLCLMMALASSGLVHSARTERSLMPDFSTGSNLPQQQTLTLETGSTHATSSTGDQQLPLHPVVNSFQNPVHPGLPPLGSDMSTEDYELPDCHCNIFVCTICPRCCRKA